MAKIEKQTVISKATRDRPDHKPLNPDQRAVLIIRHDPTGWVIRSWGWTLNEVLSVLEWSHDDIRATFVRPYSQSRGATPLVHSAKLNQGMSSLNDQ